MTTGSSLKGYTIGTTLGVGSFAKVKLGVDKSNGKQVAIKIIDKSRMATMGLIGKLSREISALQGSYHRNIIQLYDIVDTPDTIFLIMEYVDGGELFDYISQNSRLSEVEAIRIFRQILSAVDFCHRKMVTNLQVLASLGTLRLLGSYLRLLGTILFKGSLGTPLCHRDLKPENILIDRFMNIKLGDFGLSNFMKDGECLKTPCGSPNYASPEVICGKPYAGPEIDIWSCGIILYVLLCGSLPFDDDEIPTLFGKIKLGKFYVPGHLTNDTRWLLHRMLDVNPQTRITMKELLSHYLLSGFDTIGLQMEDHTYIKLGKCFPNEIIEYVNQNYTVDPYNPHNVHVETPKNVFTIDNDNHTWILGIHGIKSEFACINKICMYLAERGYVWNSRTGYRLLCKHREKPYNFVFQIYKLRYKTYLLDLQLSSGPIFPCLHEGQKILNEIKLILFNH
ncbi:serine/threonine kinase, putative [Theileria annulata]|uniref:Serine/threonine kinase, putative n=1 Tax=Theileria annulata TaxID=5874 RepID=Q4U8M8_THEAN|nr:serine/threonine kinase, putative [Theileria annulata]CAI76825.1 serine/threonine kinase, putative [Theileria annulata]|eukprot:XP_953450.1 serine/threonine kinase, putative [Theileria annulata]